MAEEKRGIWLLQHPLSKYYVEDQREIKRKAQAAYVKIYDIKLKDRVDPDLVVDHTLTLIGSEKTEVAEDTAAWDVNVTADTTNGRPDIEVTGEAAKNIDWYASVRHTWINE